MAAMFLAFGLWSLTNPAAMVQELNVEVGGPSGIFEMRGIYGGVSLGAALLCLFGSVFRGMISPALWFVITYMGGYSIGRGMSLLVGDTAASTSWMFASFEVAMFVVAAILLWAFDPD